MDTSIGNGLQNGLQGTHIRPVAGFAPQVDPIPHSVARNGVRGVSGRLPRNLWFGGRTWRNPPEYIIIAALEMAQPDKGARVQADRQTVRRVQAQVADFMHIALADLIAPAKHRGRDRVAFARHLAMYLARESTHLGVIALGELFGRDHSVVSYAHAKIRVRMAREPQFARTVGGLLRALGEPG